MRIKLLVLLLLGIAGLGAEAAIGRRRAANTCPTVALVVHETEAAPAQPEPPKKAAESGDEATVKKSVAEFAKAANARNAKAAAALWTEAGEFTDDTGAAVRGRANLEKMYAEAYAETPKGTFAASVESVRLLGKNLAASEGVLTFTPADGSPAAATKFSAMHVREGAGWLVASAREWQPEDPNQAKLADLEFLVGEWEAKRDGRDLAITYAWGEGKAYIQARYSIREKGEVQAAGTEILAIDPASGELRGWLFDKSGAVGDSVWIKDGKKWLIEASGTLPLGVGMEATNLLVPLGKDAFSWQSVDRSAGGQPLPNVAPLKVTRKKK